MSRMPESSKGRRPRRQFDEEFRNEAVRLVLDDHKTVGAVARDLDLTASALRLWVRRAQADRTHGRTGLTTAEREELARLRKENRELRTERDILKNEFRAQVRPDLWARNSVAYARPPEAVAVRFLVTFTSPLKNMVRGWPAHLSVVTPQGDPV
jgi:transposase